MSCEIYRNRNQLIKMKSKVVKHFRFRERRSPRGELVYLGRWPRATQMGILFHDFKINMGIPFLSFGIAIGLQLP